MKRTLLEILAVGFIVLMLGGMHLEVRTLKESGVRKDDKIAHLETLLDQDHAAATPQISASVARQAKQLSDLSLELARLGGSLRRVEAEVGERTRKASKQATEAISRSTALSKTVETTQLRVAEQDKRALDHARELQRLLAEQGSRFHALRKELRKELRRDAPGMTFDMLSPTVQLSGEETVGSGTLIASVPSKKGGYDTYVLTANHVIRNILADNPALQRKGITVSIYGPDGETERKCDVIVRNPKHDLALAKLRGGEQVKLVARMMRPGRIAALQLWNPVFAVGCPLGNDPIPTGGFISSLGNVVRGTKYWMINAPTYYGNSGGGIFDADSRELIAVFSKIYTHGTSRPVVIPHMGLAVPMSLVYPWLDKNGYGFLIPAEKSAAAPGK